MSEWWTYSLSDLLLFSPRVYYRLLALHNETLWPAQLLTVGLGVAILWALLHRTGERDRFILIKLGMIWIWVAGSFFWQRYATINWAAVYVVPVFVLEGLLLIGIGLRPGRPMPPRRSALAEDACLAMFGFAVIFYPLIAPTMGRNWQAAEIFGIAPDPTVIATLAVLALTNGALGKAAMLIPVAWCAITGLTLWTMGAGDFFIAPLLAVTSLGLAAAGRRS